MGTCLHSMSRVHQHWSLQSQARTIAAPRSAHRSARMAHRLSLRSARHRNFSCTTIQFGSWRTLVPLSCSLPHGEPFISCCVTRMRRSRTLLTTCYPEHSTTYRIPNSHNIRIPDATQSQQNIVMCRIDLL